MMNLIICTAWNLCKYGPEETPYLDTFHAGLIINLSKHSR